MGYYRNRRYRRSRRGSGGLAGILFLVFFFIAIVTGHFLPLLFVGLAFAALFGSFATLNPRRIYGGFQGFIWFLGLALCFTIGFWPWILLPIIISAFLGVLIRPITATLIGLGIFGAANMMTQANQVNQTPYYQPTNQQQPPPYYQPTQPEQPTYEPYQQGYQSTPQPTNQQGQPQYYYPQNQPPQQYNSGQSYEEPQAQYPQEMPPPQQ